MPIKETPSLFGGVDAAVNAILRVASYRHRATVNTLRNHPPGASAGYDIARCVHAEIATVFPEVIANPRRRRSKENWRCHRPFLDCEDASGEVGLERALVRACVRRGRSDWWNQVPIASGLVNGSAGKRSAIDLVRHRIGCSYEFVELKVDSDSALYATVEILQYGFVWLLSRQFRSELGYSTGTLLDADCVRLNVFAPPRYFRGVDFSAFESGVSSAIRDIAARQGVGMAFRIVRFPADFVWPRDYSDEALCALLDSLFHP